MAHVGEDVELVRRVADGTTGTAVARAGVPTTADGPPMRVTLASGAETRFHNAPSRLAVVCVNGGQGRDVPGTWSASSSGSSAAWRREFPALQFAELRYRIKSWNRLDMCVEDALAAIDAAGGERTLLARVLDGRSRLGARGGAADGRRRAGARAVAS